MCHTDYRQIVYFIRTNIVFVLLLLLLSNCGRPDASTSVGQLSIETPYPTPLQNKQNTTDIAYPEPGSEPTLPAVRAGPVAVLNAPSVLGLVVDKEMRVVYIEPGGSAAKTDIQIGDILASIDGINFLQDREKAKARIFATQFGQEVPLIVERANKEIKVTIIPMTLTPGQGQTVDDQSKGPLPTVTPVLPPDDYL